MTSDERNQKIFDASIGCAGAAVEYLRSVNRPLNVSYIAQTAWDIAKKLEEIMEASIKKDAPLAAAASMPIATPAATPIPVPEPMPVPVEELIDIAPAAVGRHA